MKKQILSTLIALNASITLLSGTVLAADASFIKESFKAQSTKTESQIEISAAITTSSKNANNQDYSRWSKPVTSYLYENESGGLTREEYLNSKVVIENYSKEFELQDTKEIDMELPLWGGFFAGEDYNFLIFGQKNSEENNNKEVIRVVKYSKDWQREGAASLYGANTTVPFAVGSLRITQYGTMLYIRTSHTMYKSSNGVNHQSNLTFSVRISDMAITDQYSKVMNISCGYVSHSFNQFITTDGLTLLAADHGDAAPRAVVLVKYKKEAGNDTFTDNYNFCDYVNVFPIKGAIGASDTGVSVGGLVVSDSSYLIAGNSVSQDNIYSVSDPRNIFVTSTPKNQFDADHPEIHWITNYNSSDNISVSTPQMIKIDNQRILLLYTANNEVNYTYLNEEGNQISDIYTMDGMLSDCLPILYNNKIIWYYTNNSVPLFCTIDLNSTNGTKKTGWQLINNKWYYFDPESGIMKTDWQLIRGKWYYFDLTNGDMKTGWIKWNNQWYYLDQVNGNCFINTITPDGYSVDENGALIQ